MAYNNCESLIAFLCISNILLAMTGHAFAGRGVPTNSKKTDMKKQPEWFIGSDGSYLIPGIGRAYWPPLDGSGGTVKPPIGGSTGDDIPSGNPVPSNNPVGGSSGGNIPVPSDKPVGGSSGGNIPGCDDTIAPNPGSGGYIPGGDDTISPNPGVEVPDPADGAGGFLPTPPSP